VGDLVVRPASLRATEVAPGEIPGLIDEVPLLSVLASRAEGTTVFREVGELRVKESDRLALLASNLRAVGARAEARGNTLSVQGGAAPPAGRVVTAGDHRLAMAFAVLGTLPGARVRVDDPGCAAVSFPGFHESLRALRAKRRGRS
jgi:3-phosphoshikimate 1-carboxyvinyltransferase